MNKSFGDYYLPTRFQYVILREYFNKIDAVFNMPQGEPVFTKTNIRLRSLINNLKPNSNLILLSMYMLPENKIIRNEVIAKMIKKTGVTDEKCINLVNNMITLNYKNRYNIIECLNDPYFHKVFNEKRGGGYWLWKPYIIHKTLNNMNNE